MNLKGTTLQRTVMGVFAMGMIVLGSVGGASAQDPADPRDAMAVSVRGTSTLVGQIDPGASTITAGVLTTRGSQLATLEEASDPRVTGRGLITLNIDAYRDAEGGSLGLQVRYGRMRLENEDGAWEGRFTGRLTDGGFTQTYWLVGEDAYEGLTYVVSAGGNGPVWLSTGLIYPGTPPVGASAGPLGPRLPSERPPLALR